MRRWLAIITYPVWAPVLLVGGILLCGLLLWLDKDEEL